MASVDRLTLPVPFGHHVYVVSDLNLSPATRAASRPVRDFAELLGDVDDPTVVVVAGGLLAPDAGPGALGPTLEALPALARAIRSFLANPDHRLVVLVSRGEPLESDELSRAHFSSLGASLARDLMLQVATAHGVSDLLVAPGCVASNVEVADDADRADATRLEDPTAMRRFVASRVLYRRLGPWVYVPVVAMAAFDLLNVVARVIGHVAHEHLTVHTPHTTSFWGNLTANVLLIVGLEAALAIVAGLVVRRRFERDAHAAPAGPAEPLSLTRVDDVDALEVARRVGERGGAGAVVGGAPRPALAFLDRAVCAAPGPSRDVVVEHLGRYGLPPVFRVVERLGVVEVEAASAVQVRLYAGQHARRGRLLERLAAGAPRQPSPSEVTTTLGAWPQGSPFPVSPDRLAAQRRRRTVRRWASGLILLDGVLTLGVSVSPPLRGRLHDVLNVLPLSVAQSAAAVTAIAGVAMIMMARGLRRGQRRAWLFTSLTLGVTLVAHVARGGGVVGPLLALALLAGLVTQRDHFSATTDRASLSTSL
ncbi:MAG: hypothetical protein ACRDV0_04090, partial [Acidimicrobiales bacterium]